MPRARYSQNQIFQVYERINLPARWRLDLEQAKQVSRGHQALDFLSTLKRYTLSSIPFENLELHYSRTQVIDIHPELLFQKIVSQGTGRGGYCMENNAFFANVLRTLGFEIMSTAARVNASSSPGGEIGTEATWLGYSHMVNIVTIQGTPYLVDVGFGAKGPTKPIPLEHTAVGHMNIVPNQFARLRYDTLEEFENQSSKVWIFEIRIGDDASFVPRYCFPNNVEFMPSDFIVMNHYTSTSNRSIFAQEVLAVKYSLDGDGEAVVGETVLVGAKLHRTVHGQKEDLGTLESEDDRVEALQRHLGISLSDVQRYAILGMPSMIG